MAILQADSTGRIKGKFMIPANIPAGSKLVTFLGSQGTYGEGVFVGQGSLTTQTLRQVTQITRMWYDPVAQTFALTRDAQIAGVDLWFTAKETDVRVQIRDVENGVPGRTVLAERVLKPEQIVASGGGHTRVLFPAPVTLARDTEYCLVILCNDATTALAIAQMGKFDSLAQKWVTAQPYAVGVLLTSSNASSWTAHQDMDLAFRLLEPDYTATSREISLGSATLANATDLLLYALAETPAASAAVDYTLNLPDGAQVTVAQGQAVTFAEPKSGNCEVVANLRGSTADMGPVLWPGAQLLSGSLKTTADYYTRSVVAEGASRASLIYDALIPSGASVTPEIRIDSGEWQAMTPEGTVKGDSGFVEFRYGSELSSASLIKVRLTLAGTSAARPYVSSIRLLATA